ncbi:MULTISPECIES: hypothetical protein [Sporosarcina]|uniref:hypothetical protein n=1 Tax=Sporosarcina TaxID=1569 RepID=UPI000590B0D1|nr:MULTISPECIES: hypothetical protein [Sporosarcina]WJY27113.1 hypothetical protein QWT68_13845 [Sporosarcina sp. 0.2-SM1T-5]
MPWTKDDYPATFKNETPEVRNKAIEVANALLREGYSEGRAISIGLAQARETIEGDPGDRPHFEAKTDNDDWVLTKKDSSSVIYRETSKKDLLDRAKPYVTDHEGILTIYHADGTEEDTLYK